MLEALVILEVLGSLEALGSLEPLESLDFLVSRATRSGFAQRRAGRLRE